MSTNSDLLYTCIFCIIRRSWGVSGLRHYTWDCGCILYVHGTSEEVPGHARLGTVGVYCVYVGLVRKSQDVLDLGL